MTEDTGFVFDHSAWPLVVATCPKDVELVEVVALRRAFDGWFARQQRFALITDTRPARRLPSAKWRRDLTNWMNDPVVMANVVRYNVASATIFGSTLIRGGFTALTWLWKPPQPQLAASTMREAVEWCCLLLDRAEVPLSPELNLRRADVATQG
jgi:hypothetical protein